MDDITGLAIIVSKTSAMMLVGASLAWAFAGKSASCRHFLWVSALALSLLMPFAILLLPSFAVIPASWGAWVSSASIPVAGMPGDGGTPTSVLVLLGWSIGVFACLFRDALACMGLLRWSRRATPLESLAWTGTLRRVGSTSQLNRSVRVLESPDVVTPCTWGFVRPVLLLPRAGADWPEARRLHALLHELAHIRRFDYLTGWLARLACAMHWYNPLAWFAASQARRLQEEACDDAVLRAGERPSEYAEFLLTLAAQVNQLPYAPGMAIGMFFRSSLNNRIAAILQPHRKRAPLSFLTLLAAAVPVSCLMLFVAAAAVAKPPHARSSVYSAVSLFARDTEPTGGEEPTRAQPVPAPAPSARLAAHERQRLQVLPEVVPLPPLPEVAPLPTLPPVPAVPPVPPAPAELPMLARLPELPELPQLPNESASP